MLRGVRRVRGGCGEEVRGRGQTDLEVDHGRGGVRRDGDAVCFVEDGAYGVDVVLEVAEDGRGVAEDADAVGGGYAEERGHGG